MTKNKKADETVTTAEMAKMAGIRVVTLYSYVRDGRAPQPTAKGSGRYRLAEVRSWLASRPGRGYRSDLHGKV